MWQGCPASGVDRWAFNSPTALLSNVFYDPTVRTCTVSLAASGVDRWALQVYAALRFGTFATLLKSAECIFGIVCIITAHPCLIEHTTHMHSSRYGTAVGCPRASSARNHLCASTLLSPSAVPAKWWYSTHTFVFAAPVYPQACQLSPRDARC